ncbi:MAG: hypothetical protein ACETVW_04620 [Dehalococcoidia bacterium]
MLLCPGFTHRDVAGMAEAVGENVGVAVARETVKAAEFQWK